MFTFNFKNLYLISIYIIFFNIMHNQWYKSWDDNTEVYCTHFWSFDYIFTVKNEYEYNEEWTERYLSNSRTTLEIRDLDTNKDYLLQKDLDLEEADKYVSAFSNWIFFINYVLKNE